MALESINPATGQQLASYPEMSPAEVDAALQSAANAFEIWRHAPFEDRATVIRGVRRALRTRKAELARLMALEMGKPLNQGESEVEKCATTCEYFAEHAATFLANEEITTDARRSFVSYRPIGTILGVMPWNFPRASRGSPPTSSRPATASSTRSCDPTRACRLAA